MRYKVFDEGFLYCLFVIFRWKKGPVLIHFYRNTLMLASGIKGIRVQLGIESDPSSTIFMRRRLGCPVCLQRGASPPFHLTLYPPPGERFSSPEIPGESPVCRSERSSNKIVECQRDGMSKLPSHPFLTADLEQASFGWPTLAENSFCSSNTVYKRIQIYSQIHWRLIWLQMAFGH